MAERRSGTATEEPTAERRRQARRRGEVAISADLTAALGLAAVLGVLALAAPTGVARLLGYFRGALSHAAAVGAGGSAGDRQGALAAAAQAAFASAVPLVVVPCLAALGAALLFGAVQTGGLFTWSAARPQWQPMSPRAGLRRLFGVESVGATARAVFKVILAVAVAVPVLRTFAPALPRLVGGTAAAMMAALGRLSLHLAVRMVVALAVWGVVDWLMARWRHQRTLAMTRDEVRCEQRERDGEPHQRAERRRVHRALGQQAAPEDSRSAALVVVGAGVAVAVAYDRAGGRAPIIVVNGRGVAADRVVASAHGAGVPVHDDDTLARALLETPAGDEIPEMCFEAVALLLP